VKLNASATATKYRKWRSSIILPFPHSQVFLAILAATIKTDRLENAIAGSHWRKTPPEEESLVKEQGTIARSYSNLRNKVLAQSQAEARRL
jgi:hypothetical protein